MDLRTLAQRFIETPSTDPDDARRRKLLSILILGVAISALAVLVATAVSDIQGWYDKDRILSLYTGCLVTFVAIVAAFLVNRYLSGTIASWIFLMLVLALSTFVDEPAQTAAGRSLLTFSIPIFGASLLLRSWASFIMAGASTLAIIAVGQSTGVMASPFAMVYFFAIALVSWLASRGLEQALRDLRLLNIESDQRVQERTRELAESLSKTEAILKSTADGIIFLDNNGQVTVANPAIASLLAHPVEEIVGQDVTSLMGDDVHPKDRETIRQLLQNKKMEEASTKFAWGRRTIAASIAPVQLESGEEIGTVAVFRDFTKETEVDRMKSTFVSLASHELRTPLNAILGYSEMLKEGVYGELSDRQRDATERVLANTQHMLSLANNLLDRAQIEAGTIRLNITAFSPARLVKDVVTNMEVLARNKELELSGEIAPDVPATVQGDQQRINQTLVNLIGNALKFTQEGGVRVRAYLYDQDHWALAVSDTGIGIPEDARERIFQPFRQADETATREYGGAGLGLSIVKQLVELMGGRIELESTAGKGSTFTVVMPLRPSESPPAQRTRQET